jgi:hypothetical protein
LPRADDRLVRPYGREFLSALDDLKREQASNTNGAITLAAKQCRSA